MPLYMPFDRLFETMNAMITQVTASPHSFSTVTEPGHRDFQEKWSVQCNLPDRALPVMHITPMSGSPYKSSGVLTAAIRAQPAHKALVTGICLETEDRLGRDVNGAV